MEYNKDFLGENPGKKGRAQRWGMMGGNELWVRPDTIYNMNLIYCYLRDETARLRENGWAFPEFSYARISKDCGLDDSSVSYAIKLLAFQNDPLVHITARSYVSKKKKVKLAHKVRLIRLAREDNGGDRDSAKPD